MKIKEVLIPSALLAFAVAAGTGAAILQQRENEERRKLCEDDPAECPVQNQPGQDDGIMIVPIPGGGVTFF